MVVQHIFLQDETAVAIVPVFKIIRTPAFFVLLRSNNGSNALKIAATKRSGMAVVSYSQTRWKCFSKTL